MDLSTTPGIEVPMEYRGREQTYIKHRVQKQYLQSWAQKLASVARQFGRIRIWYVDCFAGPWESACQKHEDTSIHIGLNAIQEAAAFWEAQGCKIDLGAIFVEKDPEAYQRLKTYLASRQDAIAMTIHALEGEFGSKVQEIEKLIGDDPAFLFVDPTGWKGAAMRFIAPLARKPRRDVMVNVMYDHMNRFKGSELEYVRVQLIEFFEAQVPADMSEEDLFRFYREQLKKVCGLQFSADLTVQDPCRDRTKFHLVLGAHHKTALTLFRDIEKKVVGEEARLVRLAAKEARKFERTGQYPLLAPEPPEIDLYDLQHQAGLERVEARLPEILSARGPQPFKVIVGELLQECHLTETDMKNLLGSWRTDGRLVVEGMGPKERRLKDDHVIKALAGERIVPALATQTSLFDLVPTVSLS